MKVIHYLECGCAVLGDVSKTLCPSCSSLAVAKSDCMDCPNIETIIHRQGCPANNVADIYPICRWCENDAQEERREELRSMARFIRKQLDGFAVLVTDYNHIWTEDEKQGYMASIELLNELSGETNDN